MDLGDPRETILMLKQVYEEKGLSLDKTLALVNNTVGEGVISRSTIQAVFAKGSEDGPRVFGYSVLKPLCTALLDIDHDEEYDSTDTKAYKSYLRYKKEIIDIYANQIKQLNEEKEKFQKSLEFVNNQISIKDERITDLMADRKIFIETIRELTNTNSDLTKINNELVNQLMACPLKKNDYNEG